MSAVPQPNLTLADAIAMLDKGKAGDGLDCPCCGRWAKDNPFDITQATRGCGVLWFRSQHLKNKGAWVNTKKDTPRWLMKNHAPLQWWGLLEHMPKPDDPKVKASGMWRITPKGLQFARGVITVPKRVWVFDSTVLRFDGPEVHISQCIEEFDYGAMMRHRFDGHV